MSGSLPARMCILPLIILVSFTLSLRADLGRISSVSLVGSQIRIVLETPIADAPSLLLESASSPAGPWRKEPEAVRNNLPNGYEFLTPHRSYFPQQYYRIAQFTPSPLILQQLPFIRYISPNANLTPGQLVTLYGANFAPDPSANTVKFELVNQSWTASVTEAATNYLVARVPTNLVSFNNSTGTLYRVTVTTANGTGNGVGAKVMTNFSSHTLSIRPDRVYIPQGIGSNRQVLVIGGGVPPYKLVPLSTQDASKVSITLKGPLIEAVAATNVRFGSVYFTIKDSNTNFAHEAGASVAITTIPYQPALTLKPHTLEAGTAPAFTMDAQLASFSQGNFQTEKIELHLQNVRLEADQLPGGAIPGYVQLYDPSGPYYYTFLHMLVTSAGNGRAAFDVVSLADGGSVVVAKGELIESPPTIVIDVLNQPPASLVPQPTTLQLILADQIIQLPEGPGQSFSVIGRFTSVSTQEELYSPLRHSVTNSFVTTSAPPDAPRVARLLPMHGEIYRNVRLQGAGFADTPAANTVTFTGPGGTRLPAPVKSMTPGELLVAVPPDAISGPVRVEVNGKPSNDYLFYVRFRPRTALLLGPLKAGTPAGLRLLHEQPIDEYETEDEIGIKSIFATLRPGKLALSNVSSNQIVGSVLRTSHYDGRKSTNVIRYVGQESGGARRHKFIDVTPTRSDLVFTTIFASETEDGLMLEWARDPLFGFRPGMTFDFEFTTPIYLPPPSPGDAAIRVEAVSQQWNSIPANEMRVIWNTRIKVQ